jgi:hypothetical protein
LALCFCPLSTFAACSLSDLGLENRSNLCKGTHYAIGDAKFRSRSHDAVIRIYDAAGNVVMQLRDLVAKTDI